MSQPKIISQNLRDLATSIVSIVELRDTRATCYKLVGYLPGFKGKRRQQYRQANVVVGDDSFGKGVGGNENNVGKSQGMLNFFTDEQYNQIMKMINKDKPE